MVRVPFQVSLPSADDVVGAAKELGYVAVGFGVLGFQRLQVRRRELERNAAPAVQAVRSAVDGLRGLAAVSFPCARAGRPDAPTTRQA